MKASFPYDRGLVLQFGLIVSLSLMLLAFQWQSESPPADTSFSSEDAMQLVDFEQSVVRQSLPSIPVPVINHQPTAIIAAASEAQSQDWPVHNHLAGGLPDLPDEYIDSVEVFVAGDEVFPSFPGGIEALMSYLAKNLRYHPQAIEFRITGRVFVSFVVQAEGQIANVRVLKGLGYGLDEEAVRVVKSMPRWVPGTQNGMPVAVVYNLPIQFSLR